MAWKKGQSGNPGGKPDGAKDRFTRKFWTDFFNDWDAGGPDVIRRVREDDPSTYLRIAASLMPSESNVTVHRTITEQTDQEIAARIAELRGIGTSDGDDAATRDPSKLN